MRSGGEFLLSCGYFPHPSAPALLERERKRNHCPLMGHVRCHQPIAYAPVVVAWAR